MSISAQMQGSQLVLKINGMFDINLYDEFNSAYKPYLDQASSYVIDLSSTEGMDSAALGLMLLLRQKTGGDDAKITIKNPNDDVKKVLDIAQFSQLFDIR
jgi:anti-anti-sigma factor